MPDPYQTLGVSADASADDIKQAYRRLARKLHPDLNPGDKAAEDRFKDVSSAYRLLSDGDKRRRFDAGEIDAEGNERPQQRYYRDYSDGADAGAYRSDAGYADFMDGDDVFAELLRRSARAQANRPGQDLHYRLPLTLAEAIAGGTRRITLPTGQTLDVGIPPGAFDGQVIRLKGKGAPSPGQGAPGNALIQLEVADDPRFQRDGDNLSVELPISLREAVLGGEVRLPTPTGEAAMTVPADASSGTTLRLKGQGLPRRGGGRGDLLVKLRIVLPKGDAELQRFVGQWQTGGAFDPRAETQR
ncbi:MAG: DnaJ C-terminal domain-containing protein [Pseudoxanthomonas suwonensis]|nr:DnaJ C-terminal domain-containing protein [Pseudoxanthomonas suwonensis]